MATTVNIPLTTLSVGAHDFGPAPISDTLTTSSLVIDRTVTGGMNSLTPASVLSIQIMQSNDGGATWVLIVGGSGPGGIMTWTDRNNVTHEMDTSTVNDGFLPGTGRQVKATVIVSGPSAIAVAGTLTLQ
jgi:hypothetical protein